MANELDVLQAAMTSETAVAPEPGKVRKSPYQNAYQSVLRLINNTTPDEENPLGLVQQWSEGPEKETDERILSAVLGVLETLRAKVQKLHDTPRDDDSVPGKHYVGINADGSRVAFKASNVPTETTASCLLFKVVIGPFHSAGGASYAVEKGRKADDPLVFHRKGAEKLGLTTVRKSFR